MTTPPDAAGRGEAPRDEPAQASPTDVLGAYIRAQRQLADLSLRQLASLSKVSNAYLSQIERGLHQPSLKVLRAIADALDLSGESLLSRAGLMEPGAPREARTDVESAILADPALRGEDKAVLVEVYRTLRARRPDDLADSIPSRTAPTERTAP